MMQLAKLPCSVFSPPIRINGSECDIVLRWLMNSSSSALLVLGGPLGCIVLSAGHNRDNSRRGEEMLDANQAFLR